MNVSNLNKAPVVSHDEDGEPSFYNFLFLVDGNELAVEVNADSGYVSFEQTEGLSDSEQDELFNEIVEAIPTEFLNS